jgi:hypothetical protein
MENGWSYQVMGGRADNMTPETLMSLKEDFESFILKRPHLKHLTFDEFLSIAKYCKGLYNLITTGKIKIKKHSLQFTETPPEEPQIISLCRFSRKVPHIFCSLPTGTCKLVSSPNRLRQFDLRGRYKH